MNFKKTLNLWCLSLLLYFIPFLTFSQEISPTISNYPGGYNISCHGANDGSISLVVVGGDAPYLFNWSNGSTSKNQTQLAAGSYTVIVTDASANTTSMDFDLTQPKAILVVLHPRVYEGGYNILKPGGSDGAIEAEISGGVQPYTFSWTNNTSEQNVKDVSAGTYTLTVTDVNSCTSVASTTLIEGTGVQIIGITSPSHNGYNVSCDKEKDGAIELTVIGGHPPYNYTWNDGSTEEDRTELGPGSYSVIVRDDNGVGDAAQIQLTGPTKFTVQLSPTVYSNGKNISCYGCANGHINTIVTGGVSPYTYSWNDGATSANRSGLTANQYNVQITDANGCMTEAGVNIQGPEREDWTMTGNAATDPAFNYLGTTDNKDLVFRSNNIERLKIKGSGQIEVKSTLKVDSSSTDSLRSVFVDSQGVLRVSSPTGQQVCTTPTNRWVTNYCTSGNDIYNLPLSGNVGIGTSQIPTGYKLAVNGRIICEELKVKLSTTWPDFVFKTDYKLMPLSELKKFIQSKNHLPDIPSAEEVEIGGSSIGEMQAKLLQKIEELTLYLVQQNEKLVSIEAENLVLTRKVDLLSNLVKQ